MKRKSAKSINPNHKRGYTLVELLLVMLLLALFGITVVTIIQSGSVAYAKVADNRAAESDARIAVGYIDVRIRQNDVQGGLQLVGNPLGEGNALIFRELIDETIYVTWIFYVDGVLYECPLLYDHEVPTLPICQPIATLDDFTFERISNMAIKQTATYTVRRGENETSSEQLSSTIVLRAADLDYVLPEDTDAQQ